MRFYLGTHKPNWLWETAGIPLFVSHRALARLKSYRARAISDWALDSGGFTEIDRFGRWVTTETEYVEATRRYQDEIGRLVWAAPQDWMCEPHMLEKTGLTVREHQHRTIASYLSLRDQGPFIPVLQGWTLPDYIDCIGMYRDAGIDLAALPVVGVGSVCRRQRTAEIADIFRELAGYGLSMHGFGVKTGLYEYGEYLVSADSLAWSYNARRSPPIPGHERWHKNCANCLDWALDWRRNLLARL